MSKLFKGKTKNFYLEEDENNLKQFVAQEILHRHLQMRK